METIYELPMGSFERARHVLGRPPADLAYIDSALTGLSPARLFVDDPERPNAALLVRTYEYFVGGATGTALDRFIADTPPEVGFWADFYGLVAVDPVWTAHTHRLHPAMEWIGRRSFRFDPARIDAVRGWDAAVPEDVAIVPLTAELARLADREMPEMVGLFWGGYTRYAERGFGVLALIDGHPVSICYSVGVGGGEANAGVMTVAALRRRGLAAICSRAFVEMAHERGLVATWDCDEANPASAALAMHVGFVEHAPFNEWAFPERAKPVGAAGVWTVAEDADGMKIWRRTGK